jgi:hypothetical protein
VPLEINTNLFPRPGKRGRPKKNLDESLRDERSGRRTTATNREKAPKGERPKTASRAAAFQSTPSDRRRPISTRQPKTESHPAATPPDPINRSVGRPRRQVRAPGRLGIYLLALFCSLTCVSGKVVYQTDGVFFLKDREILFTDSDWIVSTDITFDPIQTVFTSLRNEIERKLLRHPVAFDADLWWTTRSSGNKTTSERQDRSEFFTAEDFEPRICTCMGNSQSDYLDGK